MQCACNALLAACWSKVCKVSCWSSFHLDHVLDLGDNLFRNLRLNRYLDAPDVPEHGKLDGCYCDMNKGYLHDEEDVIDARFLLYLFIPTARKLDYYS